MQTIDDSVLRMLVHTVQNYFKVTTPQEPQITSAYLGSESLETYEFNGVVAFSGSYEGHVTVSMPAKPLKELLLLQGETQLTDANLLDAVGEIANTLAGNARKTLGRELQISVPTKLQGIGTLRTRSAKRPYVITLRWNHQNAMVCVDMVRCD